MDDTQRLETLYELALTREPTQAERQVALSFLAGEQGLLEGSGQASGDAEIRRQAWIGVCQAVLASNEFRHVK